MKTLLEKDYVYKSGCPSRFSLTDIGMPVAQQMVDTHIEQNHETVDTVVDFDYGFDFDFHKQIRPKNLKIGMSACIINDVTPTNE